MRDRRQSRQRAEQRGRTAELLAALWLMAKGYRILAHRARTPFGEVDLAARPCGLLPDFHAMPARGGDARRLHPRDAGAEDQHP